MKQKLMMLLAVATMIFGALAMPTKEEVKEVQPVVNELMVEHVNAYRARKKSAKDVGNAAFGLVGEAEGDAAKYLLFKVAINYYSLAKDFEKAADALEAMQSQIKDLPASEVQTLASAALNRAGRGEAQRIRAMLRMASTHASAEKEIEAFKDALRKNGSDTAALRGLANAYVKVDDWPRALKVFAKMGVKAAAFELGRDDAGDCNALKAADYWWAFTAQGRILRGACWVNGDSIKFIRFIGNGALHHVVEAEMASTLQFSQSNVMAGTFHV